MTFNPCPKPPKTGKKPRKRLPRTSKKRREYRASDEGKAGMDYMALAGTLPCAACGSTSEPRDLHHAKDKPPHGEDGPYQKSPHRFSRSGDFDVIPLCKWKCHNGGPNSYHTSRDNFRALYGPDYGFILSTRAKVAALGGVIDF